MIKNLLANWKTTSAGILLISGSVIHLVFAVRAGHNDEATWTASVTGIVGGFGLLAAGDAGAKPSQPEPLQIPPTGPKSEP